MLATKMKVYYTYSQPPLVAVKKAKMVYSTSYHQMENDNEEVVDVLHSFDPEVGFADKKAIEEAIHSSVFYLNTNEMDITRSLLARMAREPSAEDQVKPKRTKRPPKGRYMADMEE